MRRSSGFTIVEMLTAMLVLAIIAAFAVPNYDGFRRNIAIDSNTSKIRNAFAYARSEAVSRNNTVSACIANADADACDDNLTDWAGGWIVFEDQNGNGEFDDNGVAPICEADVDDCVLRVWEDGISQDGTMEEMTAPNARFAVTFDARGYEANQQRLTLELRMNGCGDGELNTIEVLPLGRVEVTAGDC